MLSIFFSKDGVDKIGSGPLGCMSSATNAINTNEKLNKAWCDVLKHDMLHDALFVVAL